MSCWDTHKRIKHARMVRVDVTEGVDFTCILKAVHLAVQETAGVCAQRSLSASQFAVITSEGPTGAQVLNQHMTFFDDEEKAVLAFEYELHTRTAAHTHGSSSGPPNSTQYRIVDYSRVNEEDSAFDVGDPASRQEPDSTQRHADAHEWQLFAVDSCGYCVQWHDCSIELSDCLDISLRDSNRNENLCERILTIDGGTTRFLLNLWDMTLTAMPPSKKDKLCLWKLKQPAVVVSVTPAWDATSLRILGSHKPKARTMERTLVVIEPAPDLHTRAATNRYAASDGTVMAQINQKGIPVDPGVAHSQFASASWAVVEDFDATLVHCDITGFTNRNIMYKMQLLRNRNGQHGLWSRWGRVGDRLRPGLTNMRLSPESLEAICREFKRLYRAKTGIAWDDRMHCEPELGMYDLVHIDYSARALSIRVSMLEGSPPLKNMHLPCTLDEASKSLIELICTPEIMMYAMPSFDIDPAKIPLGALAECQVRRGIKVLDDIQAAISQNETATIRALSSRFYTAIPHAFGSWFPSPLDGLTILQEKYDMCDALIRMAFINKKLEEGDGIVVDDWLGPHPADLMYAKLGADLELLEEGTAEFQVLSQYFETTKDRLSAHKLQNIWRVRRHGEDASFDCHKHDRNRMLLWHGTRTELVAAILAKGLRIMPFASGRGGKALYLACEQAKAAVYERAPSNGTACMFLVEAVLGRPFEVRQDDGARMEPPSGFQSMVARGLQGPEQTAALEIDGHKLVVPLGPSVDSHVCSMFRNNEYMFYDESRVRLRYLVSHTTTGPAH
jgi:poly [ADP-ribose] polymerase 2/3/4